MTRASLILALCLAGGTPASAEEEAKPLTPLVVSLTVSRYEGERKTGSLPYSLYVVANHAPGARLRLGTEVPVPVTTVGPPPPGQGAEGKGVPGAGAASTSFQYRNVGVNIDSRADSLDEGRFQLRLTMEHSAVATTPEGRTTVRDVPMFRTFRSEVSLILRPGQTAQYVAATDPVTGESVRVDVALGLPR
jgi:hypothetical protein